MVGRAKIYKAVTRVHFSGHRFLIRWRTIIVPFMTTWDYPSRTVGFGILAESVKDLNLTIQPWMTTVVGDVVTMQGLQPLTGHYHDGLSH
ncbi:hypothetical protein D3C76_1647170 [compost metagenome]